MLKYKKLIEKLEQDYLPENKKISIIDYMKKNCDYNFTNDIIGILNNYNNIILQSIQAIKNLISENEKNFKDLNSINSSFNDYEYSILNNNDYNKMKMNELNLEYQKYNNHYKERINIRTNILKKPIREQIKFSKQKTRNLINLNPFKSLTPNTSLRILLSSKKNNNKRNLTINNNIISKEKKKELEIMKRTNDILKLIELTSKHKKMFCDKYIGENNNNINANYKSFLDNIINYKYNIDILNNIYKDILNFCVKCSLNRNRNDHKFNLLNTYSKFKYRKKEFENNYSDSQNSFEKNLRNYQSLVNKINYNNKNSPKSEFY